MGRPPLPIGAWGDVNVTQESPGVWRASARYRGNDGRTRSYSRRRQTKGAAKHALLEALTDMQDGDRHGVLTPESRVSDLVDSWFADWKVSEPRRINTVRAHQRAADNAKRRVGGLRIIESTTGRLETAVNAVRDQQGLETGRQMRAVLIAAFATAVRLDLIGSNPALGISTRARTREPVRALNADEVKRLRAAARWWEDVEEPPAGRPWAPRRIAASIDVLLGTGMRIGEVLALRWEDVDLTTVPATVTVSGTLVRDGGTVRQPSPKSDMSERVLYLPKFTTEALRTHRGAVEAIPDSGAVFPSRTGGWWAQTSYRRWFDEVRSAAGLDWVTPHVLRKTVASAVYSADGLKNAGQQLGHSEVGVTSRHYVQRSNFGPVEVVAVMDNLVG